MSQYKVFIKDCLDLEGMAVANVTCLSFQFSKDLLTSATSSFTVLDEIANIKNGDILGLVDPFGTILYEGVVENFTANTIQCKELLSMFNDEWLWYDPSASTIEGKLQDIIETDFVNSSDSLIAKKFPFSVTADTSTAGTFEAQEENFVTNFESFINGLYDQYGVIVDINIPFEAGTPTINIHTATTVSLKVGNNMWAVQNLTPLTEVVQLNKLSIYDKAETLRGNYYCTVNGITSNDADPLRLPVVKTRYIFDDETPLEDLVAENLQAEIYNHKITFDLLLDSTLYEFTEWELGQPLDIWFNTDYYSSIFTAYSVDKQQGSDVAFVSVTCGKVRNTLTEKLNGK